MGILAAIVLAILTFSGSLGLAEALVAFAVFAFAALAYYLATGVGEFGGDFRPTAQQTADQPLPKTGAETVFEDVRQIIRTYPHPALLVGYDGRVYVANTEARNVFRLPRSGGIGPSIIRRADVLSRLGDLAAGKTPPNLDIEVAGTPDRYFQVWSAPVTIQDEPRVLMVLIELTELRRAEKARADFLANASHELRTPLTSLAGFIETMRGPAKDDPEAWDRFLEIMYGQTERMRRLIHDLLSLSRIELSEYHKPQHVLDFTSLVEETFEAMLPIARDRGVQLELISSVGAVSVHGVRDELMQVMQNLIENALKYTHDNTTVIVELAAGLTLDQTKLFTSRRWDDAARISILQTQSEESKSYVAVRVSDEGNGIGREHLPRLGERFYRTDESRDRMIGGTGLGLAIVKHILARHRGGFVVESQKGRGSAFGFWLPVIQPDARSHDRLQPDNARQDTQASASATLPPVSPEHMKS